MPRTQAQLQKALADTEAWLDTLDVSALTSPDSDGKDQRAVGNAPRALAASELAPAQQVQAARANVRYWTQIAALLGVSKQAARERFAEPALHQSSQ